MEKKHINFYVGLIWLGVALALGGVALIFVNLNETVQNEAERAFQKNLRFIAESSAKSVKLFMEGVISEIVFQTQLEVVKNYRIDKVDEAFRSVIFRQSERISHLVLLDGSGNIKVMVTKDPDPFQMRGQIKEFFRATMGGWSVRISDHMFESDTYRGIAVGMPIFRKLKGNRATARSPSAIYASGMVIALISVDDLTQNLIKPVRIEKSGFAMLRTASGDIMGDPERMAQFTTSLYGPGDAMSRFSDEFGRLLGGGDVTGWKHIGQNKRSLSLDMGYMQWFLATSPIDIMGRRWTMAVAARQSEISHLLTTSFRQSVMLVGFVVVIFLIGGSMLTRVNRRLARAEEKARLAAELEEKNLSLEEMNRRMDEFVAIVSHDIRSPLNVVRGFIKVIQSSPEGAVFERETSSMLRSCNRLTQLTNDILDIAKLEAGKLKLAYDPIILDNIIMESVQTMEFAIRKKDQKTIVNLGEQTHMEGDSGKLLQVMNNLIGNAVKFTPQGGSVTISKEIDDGSVCVKVTDTGPGIDVDDLGIVFSKFEQVRRHQQGIEPGSGLGLMICKNIVELHGGMIGVNSSLGQGSTFYVTLPLRKPLSKQ